MNNTPPVAPALSHRELARLITGIENGDEAALTTVRRWYPHGGQAHLVGLTGAPGSGKSTLISALAKTARARRKTVAILSIDPSSPFTGGAILGDRIRMRELHADPGVFIRSMASRGALGGIASATSDAASALDAAGFDLILIETVGAGQSDVEVARVGDTVIVVEAPGLGDDVQAIKAGILEIADIVVVNKADRDGAEATVSALKAALELGATTSGHHGGHHGVAAIASTTSEPGADWPVPICKTIATLGEGVNDLLNQIERHAAFLTQSDAGARRHIRHAEQEVLARLRDLLLRRTLSHVDPAQLRTLVEACAVRRIHPDEAARALLDASG